MLIIKIVYHDHGGAHTSVVASGIHSGRLRPDIIPSKEELMQVPFFDQTTKKDFGKIKYIGKSQDGHEIYSLGTKFMNMGVLLKNLANLQGISNQFAFYDTMAYVDNRLRLGGWLSRGLSLPVIGRPLVISGILAQYIRISSFVRSICSDIGGSSK